MTWGPVQRERVEKTCTVRTRMTSPLLNFVRSIVVGCRYLVWQRRLQMVESVVFRFLYGRRAMKITPVKYRRSGSLW